MENTQTPKTVKSVLPNPASQSRIGKKTKKKSLLGVWEGNRGPSRVESPPCELHVRFSTKASFVSLKERAKVALSGEDKDDVSLYLNGGGVSVVNSEKDTAVTWEGTYREAVTLGGGKSKLSKSEFHSRWKQLGGMDPKRKRDTIIDELYPPSYKGRFKATQTNTRRSLALLNLKGSKPDYVDQLLCDSVRTQVEYQGAQVSRSAPSYSSVVEFPEQMFARAWNEFKEVLSVVGVDDVPEMTLRDVICAINLGESEGTTWAINFYAFLSCDFMKELVNRVSNPLGLIAKWFKIFAGTEDENALEEEDGPDRVITQSLTAFDANSYGDVYTRIRHAKIVNKTIGFVIDVMANIDKRVSTLESKNFITSTFMWLVSEVTDSIGLIDQVIALIAYWTDRLKAVNKPGGSWSDLFEPRLEEVLIRLCDEVDEKLNDFRQGQAPPGDDLRTFLVTAKDSVRKGIYISNPTVKKRVEATLEKINVMMAQTKMRRVAPAGVIIRGDPGTGKTLFTDTLAAVYKSVYGIPLDSNITHTYQPSVEHQKLAPSILILEINDTFSTKGEHTEMGLDFFQSLVDTAPLQMSAASIEEKNLSYIAPHFVVASTNAEKYTFSKQRTGADKLDRRYTLIESRVNVSEFHKTFPNLDPKRFGMYVASGAVQYERRFIEWRLGWMDNSPKRQNDPNAVQNEVVFQIAQEICPWDSDTTNIVSFLIGQYAKNKQEYGSLCRECNSKSCICRFKDKIAGYREALNIHLPITIQETPPQERSLFSKVFGRDKETEAGEVVTQGQVPSISIVGSLDQGQMDYLKGTLESLIGEPIHLEIGAHTARMVRALIVVIGCGALAATINTCINLITRKKRNTYIDINVDDVRTKLPVFKEGAAFTKLANAGPPAYVHPTASSSAPWLGKPSIDCTWRISASHMSMYCVQVHATMFLLPRHFFEGMELGAEITLTKGDNVFEFAYDPETVYSDMSKDMCALYVAGTNWNGAKFYDSLPATCCLPTGECTLGSYQVDIVPGHSSVDRIAYKVKGGVTQKGDCGLVLSDASKHSFGLHFGLMPRFGLSVATPISKADVHRYISEFAKREIHIVPQGAPLEPIEGLQPGFHERSDAENLCRWQGVDVRELGRVEYGHFQSVEKEKMFVSKTELEPIFGELCGPMSVAYAGKAKLTPNKGWWSPTVKILTAPKSKIRIKPKVMKACVESYVSQIRAPSRKLEPYDLGTVLAGSRENVFVNPRDMDKAVGWALKIRGITKQNAFTLQENGEYLLHPVLEEQYNRISKGLRGELEMPVPMVKATHKNEVISLEKFEDAGGRIFFVNDLAFNLHVRRLMLPILAYLMERVEESRCVVAINAGSKAWDALSSRLLKFGNNRILAGDYKVFDMSHGVVLYYVDMVYSRLAEKFGYDVAAQKELSVLLRSLHHYYLLSAGNVIYMTNGLTSGRSDTIHTNCIANLLILMYSYSMSYLEEGHSPYVAATRFFTEVEPAVTGDDNISGVKEGSAFSPERLIKYAGELGYEITGSDKDSVLRFTSLEEATYLKRGFVHTSQGWKAPLALKSIYKMVSYYDQKMSEEKLFERNVNTVLCAQREMFLHGREMFDEFCSLLPSRYPKLDYIKLEVEYEHGLFATWIGMGARGAPLPSSHNFDTEVEYQGEGEILIRDGRINPPAKLGFVEQGPRIFDPWTERSDLFNALFLVNEGMNPSSKTCVDDRRIFHAKRCVTELNSNLPSTNDEMVHPVVTVGADHFELTSAGVASVPTMSVPYGGVSLSQYFERPRLITTWGTGTVADVDLYAALLASPEVSSAMAGYSMFRADIRVTIAVTGSTKLLGGSRIYAYPKLSSTDMNEGNNVASWNPTVYHNYPATSQLPHHDVDYSMTNTYVLELPYMSPRDYLEKEDIQDQWHLCIAPYVPATSINGTSAPTLNIAVYANFTNMVLDRIIPQGKEPDPAPPGVFSRSLTYGSRIAASFPGIYASAASKALSLGADVAQYFGMSKTPSEPTVSMVQKYAAGLATCSGETEFAQTLGIDPACSRSVIPRIPMTVSGETEFGSLSRRWGDLSNAWPAGMSMPVTPMVVHRTSSTGTGFWLTPIAFATSMFEKWTGSLEFKVRVYSNPLIRWRIGLVVVPLGVAVPLAFPDEGFLTKVVEVSGSTEVTMEVPYLFPEPFQYVFQNISGPMDMYVEGPVGSYSGTRLVWYSLMEPNGPSETPVYPIVTVAIRAGPTFSVGTPTLENVKYYGTILQGGPGLGAKSTVTFGEQVDDLVLLTKRSCLWVDLIQNDGMSEGPLSWPVAIPGKPAVLLNTNYVYKALTYTVGWTYASWMECAFLGSSGSAVFRVMYSRQDNAEFIELAEAYTTERWIANTSNNPLNSASIGFDLDEKSSLGVVLGQTRNNVTVDARVPDRSIYPFRPGNPSTQTGKAIRKVMMLPATRSDIRVKVFQCTGEDYLIGGFLAAPCVNYAAYVT